ncbi:MAG: heat-inducible transcriptional repressor HrcA, partial [Pseudomonadota bacterium]
MSKDKLSQLPNERAGHLLKVLVERYIRDGTPVGSRTLSRDSGLDLSPATIRNVMSDLEMLGLISAPHTSAGRIPTPQGYRVFVDSLIKFKPPSARQLSQIEEDLTSGSSDQNQILAQASNLLSSLTEMAGVVTVPKPEKTVLRQIEFLSLSDNRVLAILIMNEKDVQNRILNTSRNYTESELRAAANFVNRHFAGRELTEVRELIVQEMDKTRDSMNQAMLDAVAFAGSALSGSAETGEDLLLAGETKLMDFAELSDMERLRQLFDAFSEKRLVLDLLDRSIQANGIQIFIGEESGYQILD